MAQRGPLSDSAPIAVTGAGGFIAGFIVEQLLAAGRTVHGTVRDPSAKKNDFLRDIAKRNPSGKLKLFAADLEKEGSFDEAIKGCEVVVHTAAVVKTHFDKDPNVEVVDPTVNGVTNVVASCKRHNVRRIVYTSSVSTIMCIDKYRKQDRRGQPFKEDDWVSHVTPFYGTYNFAKIQAEKALMRDWGDRELISLLPSWCVGPLQQATVSSSQQVIDALLRKQFGSLLCPRLYIHWVDVRDVAAAHVFAATRSDMPNGRYNVAGPACLSTTAVAQRFNEIDPTLKLPTAMMPWAVMWTASWWDKRLTSFFLYEKVVETPAMDSSKLTAAGFTFQHYDLDKTLRAALDSWRSKDLLKTAK